MTFGIHAGVRPSLRGVLVIILVGTAIGCVASVSPAAEPGSPATPVVVADQASAAALTASRPLTADELALQAIVTEGQARVAALLARGQADPSRMDEIQREIGRVKADTNVRFLQAKADFARARADEAELQEAQQALEMVLNPPAPAPATDARAGDAAKGREVGK